MQKAPHLRFAHTDKSKGQFFQTLKKRVDEYFIKNNLSKHYNTTMVIKTIVMLAMYLLPFVSIVLFTPSFGISLILWAVMGLGLAGVGMSVMHDANHEAYSSDKTLNKLLGHTLNLLGGSVFNWKLQHNILHHTYTNVVHMDDDIDDKLILRFSPHTRVKSYQKFQFIYAFLLYGILTLYWAIGKDFVQFYQYTKRGVNKNSKRQNRITLVKIIFEKVLYFTIILIIPIVIIGIPIGEHIAGFLVMQFVASVVLTVIFQLAHTVEHTSHPLPNDKNTIENDWAIHQMNTTVNFSRNNKLISWYVGGLNFQVEHHLFPTICHVHYPEISKIVKATAEEYNVPYLENKTFGAALKSHVRTLQRFGKMPNLNEAIG